MVKQLQTEKFGIADDISRAVKHFREDFDDFGTESAAVFQRCDVIYEGLGSHPLTNALLKDLSINLCWKRPNPPRFHSRKKLLEWKYFTAIMENGSCTTCKKWKLSLGRWGISKFPVTCSSFKS